MARGSTQTNVSNLQGADYFNYLAKHGTATEQQAANSWLARNATASKPTTLVKSNTGDYSLKASTTSNNNYTPNPKVASTVDTIWHPPEVLPADSGGYTGGAGGGGGVTDNSGGGGVDIPTGLPDAGATKMDTSAIYAKALMNLLQSSKDGYNNLTNKYIDERGQLRQGSQNATNAGLDLSHQILNNPNLDSVTGLTAGAQSAFNPGVLSADKQLAQLADIYGARSDEYKTAMSTALELQKQGAVSSDVQDIAQAIVSGIQPPDLSRLYGKASAVRAELARQGYDLTKATTDWMATTKFIASSNSPQQVRMRQAEASVENSLGKLAALNDDYKRSNFKFVNKADLIAATNGLYGEKAASQAQMMLGQIGFITDELAQTFMGGNSPTDPAFKIAQQVLGGDFTAKQLEDEIKLIQENLNYRKNSWATVGAMTSGGGTSQYSNSSNNNDPLGIY